MTDKKISQLAAATLPLTRTELVPVVQGGVTKQVPASALVPDVVPLDGIQFDVTATPANAVGLMRWNDVDGCPEVILKGGLVTLQLGQEETVLTYNDTPSTLGEGKVVRVTGSFGNIRQTVALAQANTEVNSATTFGVMTENASPNATGFCTFSGLVRNIKTDHLTQGAPVYLSSSVAGEMTSVQPEAPNHIVVVGFCVYSNATQGIVWVSVTNGFELNELHDVAIAAPATGDVLQLGADGVWRNNPKAAFHIDGSDRRTLTGLPTADPGVPGVIYNQNGTLKVSQ